MQTPRKNFIIPLTVVAMLLGLMLTVQISSLEGQQNTVGANDYLTDLDQVNQQQQENALLDKQISETEAQLATYEASGSSVESRRKALRQDQKAAEAAAGLTSASGAGLTIVIKADPSLPDYNEDITLFDPQRDLGYLVNLLYSQGATAISIQGSAGGQQRLVTTSAIRDVIQTLGQYNSVEVNGVAVPAPYTVRAIGDSSGMRAILLSEDFAQELNQEGMDCKITVSKKLTILGYKGSMPGTYAKEVNAK